MVFTELMESLTKGGAAASTSVSIIGERPMDYLNETFDTACALHFAIAFNVPKAFNALLDKGVDIKKVFDTNKLTALPYNFEDVTRALESIKLDITALPYNGNYHDHKLTVSPVVRAPLSLPGLVKGAKYDPLEMAKHLGRRDMVSRLEVISGVVGNNLHKAIASNDQPNVRKLIEEKKKSYLESDDDGGASPIHLAIWHNNEEAFSLLMEKKVDLTSTWEGAGNCTPLQLAVSMNRHLMVSRLSIGIKFETIENEMADLREQVRILQASAQNLMASLSAREVALVSSAK